MSCCEKSLYAFQQLLGSVKLEIAINSIICHAKQNICVV